MKQYIHNQVVHFTLSLDMISALKLPLFEDAESRKFYLDNLGRINCLDFF